MKTKLSIFLLLVAGSLFGQDVTMVPFTVHLGNYSSDPLYISYYVYDANQEMQNYVVYMPPGSDRLINHATPVECLTWGYPWAIVDSTYSTTFDDNYIESIPQGADVYLQAMTYGQQGQDQRCYSYFLDRPGEPTKSDLYPWFAAGLSFGFLVGCTALAWRFVRQAGRTSPEI